MLTLYIFIGISHDELTLVDYQNCGRMKQEANKEQFVQVLADFFFVINYLILLCFEDYH